VGAERVYRVRFSRQAQQQAAHLPETARAALADAVEQLRDDPWQGTPYRPGYPPEHCMLAFSEWGIVVYVIGERAAIVMVLELAWAG
jgi:hypothetical protein